MLTLTPQTVKHMTPVKLLSNLIQLNRYNDGYIEFHCVSLHNPNV